MLRRAPLLGRRLTDGVAERLADALGSLAPAFPRLVHGDLGPVHVLLERGRPTGLLDFAYISTVSDPAFLVLYRATYGLVTATCLAGHPGRHLDWCLALVDVRCRPRASPRSPRRP